MLQRREVSLSTERKILTALIVSGEMCREIIPIARPEYFRSEYVRRVFTWVKDYFESYEVSPGENIQDVYEQERSKLTLNEAELISEFLLNLSSNYETDMESGNSLNIEYEKERALNYFRERSLIVVADEVKSLVNAGLTSQAESAILSYHQVAKDMSSWVDPFDSEYVSDAWSWAFLPDEERPDFLFSFPGYLGRFMGSFHRNWLVSFLGPMKRGKTFTLIETAFQAILSRLNVAFFSFEMSDKNISSILYKRVTNFGRVIHGIEKYPCMDCWNNQAGTCVLKMSGGTPLLDKEGEKPEYNPNMKYSPCTNCRGTKRYVPATWWNQLPKTDSRKARSAITTFRKSVGDRLRLQSFPAYSANVRKIVESLEQLDHTEGFVPEVIIIDYADILAPEDERLIGRDRIDQTWKMLKSLSSSHHCLVLTATQAQRETLKKRTVEDVNVGEDVRKLAHVDAMYSLNQTSEEKAQGVMRIGVVNHRHRDFDKRAQCLILQNLSYGQPLLDSEKFFTKKDENEK